MFNTKKWKFNKYCEMYADLFNESVPKYDKVDYISLQQKVIDKLSTMSFTNRQHLEVILKDNLHEFKDGSTDFKQFYGAMIAFFSGIAGAYLKNFIDKGSLDSYFIFNAFFYGITFFILYTMFIEVIFNNRVIVKSGFYEWCLNLLDKYENGKFDIDDDVNKTLNQIAATVEQEEQLDSPVKPNYNQTNGNWNITISTPSIIDNIESIYKLGKFIKKMFRKKK